MNQEKLARLKELLLTVRVLFDFPEFNEIATRAMNEARALRDDLMKGEKDESSN